MRVIFLNILLGFFAILFSILLGEVSVRIFAPTFSPTAQIFFYKSAGDKPTLGPPNTSLRQTSTAGDYNIKVFFNKYGLRDEKDFSHGSIDDLYVIGDSFAFGWGVAAEDRFSNQIERLTGRRAFNIATPGDFDNYKKQLKYARGLGANIRQVIVAVCMENDLKFYDAPKILDITATDGQKKYFDFQRLKVFLKAHSALYGFLSAIIHQRPKIKAIAKGLGLIVKIDEAFSQNTIDQKIIRSSVEKLVETVRSYKAVILIIPSRALWVGENKIIAQKIHNIFVSELKVRDQTVVDMKPILELEGEPLNYHFQHDGHWTPEAHFKAARALQSYLTETSQ